MSNRTQRVNVLLQREISAFLHTRYQAEAVRVTITEVRVAPDLRDARVYYSVIGGASEAAECGRWLRGRILEIRQVVGRRVVLKNVPRLRFVLDTAGERAVRMDRIFDAINPPGSRQ